VGWVEVDWKHVIEARFDAGGKRKSRDYFFIVIKNISIIIIMHIQDFSLERPAKCHELCIYIYPSLFPAHNVLSISLPLFLCLLQNTYRLSFLVKFLQV
jgi:hypothetical protein